MTILEWLHFLARGGRSDYLHKNGKENKKTTKLQNFLDTVSNKS
jgi:hypothetical protein